MKTCPFCNATIDDDSYFCDQCGKELKICFECGSFVRGKYCSGCRSTNIGLANEKAGKVSHDSLSKALTSAKGQSESNSKSASPADREKDSLSELQQSGNKDCSLTGVEKQITMILKVAKGSYTIGRKTGEFLEQFCDDNYISRKHACLVFDTNEHCWRLSDLGSTNGTYVNGFRLTPETPVALKQGDMVRFAYINFKFQ